jgi:DNA invertase Pin-like site-specific DNA recombinase
MSSEKITALYSRLSSDDGNDSVSNSMANQRKLLENYAAEHGFANVVHFADDGFSGCNWERPAWKSLLSEIEAGNVQTLITKDVSRIGRDFLQVGYFMEIMLRKHEIRLISVADNIDSDVGGTLEFAPFLNLMNEWYARDCSRKVKAVARAKGNAGIPLAAVPPYGYKKCVENKNKWLADEPAAAVVRRIFGLASDGFGASKIARILTEEQVEKPSSYKRKNTPIPNPYNWNHSTVKSMLTNPEYAGHTVNFKTYKESYKDKKAMKNAPENLKIFRDTHEAIIEQSTFDFVQELLNVRVSASLREAKEISPLAGVIFCKDCGEKMYHYRNIRHINGGYFVCSTNKYSRVGVANVKCSPHRIKVSDISELVLDSIRRICFYANNRPSDFVEQCCENTRHYQTARVILLKEQIAKNEKRIAELRRIFRSIYEEKALGKIADCRYESVLAEYRNEQSALEKSSAKLQSELNAYTIDYNDIGTFGELAEKYADAQTLTASLVSEFIGKIAVYEPVKNARKIEIYFNLIGNFKIPETPNISTK